MEQIKPHGGKLINLIVKNEERDTLLEKAKIFQKVELNKRELSDMYLLSIGAFSPLEGFMTKKDYNGVVDNMRLSSGYVWTIPITLSVDKNKAEKINIGEKIALTNNEEIIAVMDIEDKFEFDKDKEAIQIYGTNDIKHPGVAYLNSMKEILLGGKVSVLHPIKYTDFINYHLTPEETRKVFKGKGWRRIVAFQTRNPIHRAHEYLQKCALEVVDGLMIHPIVGETKGDDIPANVRMKCYEVLLDLYYPKDRTMLVVLPAAMRYAGPKEAIFHALIRKNYGCTHFIVGRDHAGVGNYYGTFDAHYIFDEFESEDIGITPLFFDHSFYCKKCEGMASYKTCPHEAVSHIILSGTRVREMLGKGEIPPHEFTRPEVAKILIEASLGK
ncbi:MAG: sulfate adenylyltransferase [Candidatus Firestonebacteria bacterium]|nr:sulfate adenylyltransferase [Candidatus Firestonebacteria bacterium]